MTEYLGKIGLLCDAKVVESIALTNVPSVWESYNNQDGKIELIPLSYQSPLSLSLSLSLSLATILF